MTEDALAPRALAARAPRMRVRPVEPEGFDDVARSLATGTLQTNEQRTGSVCDAVIAPSAGELTFPILRSHCGPGLVVSDAQALHAMAVLFSRLKIVAEPGGAIALAAALEHDSGSDPVVVVVSGGNVDADMFSRALGAEATI